MSLSVFHLCWCYSQLSEEKTEKYSSSTLIYQGYKIYVCYKCLLYSDCQIKPVLFTEKLLSRKFICAPVLSKTRNDLISSVNEFFSIIIPSLTSYNACGPSLPPHSSLLITLLPHWLLFFLNIKSVSFPQPFYILFLCPRCIRFLHG